MRSRLAPWLILLTFTAAGAAAAAGYGLTAPKRYRATAAMLVAPVSPGDPTFAGIGVLVDTGGKRTAAADVAALLRTPQIADAVAAQLALKRSRNSLQHAVRTRVVDSSDVVAVTAEDTSAAGAAQLANTFANALITQRSASFQSQLGAAIRRDEAFLSPIPAARRASGEAAAIARRLTTLRGLQGQPDPTVRIASQAATPTSEAWPKLPRLIAIGAASGAALGLLAALVLLGLRRGRRAGGGQYDRTVSESALEKLVDRLEAKLSARESALAARERDLQAALDELRAAQAAAPPAEKADDSELVRREQQLSARLAGVTAREVELARRAAALALREREFDARPEPTPEPEPTAPEPKPEPAPAPPPAAAAPGRNGFYNLTTLEHLVGTRGSEFPGRVEEWSSYLYFLRDYADADGFVPASFDALIAETFADLV